MGRLMTTLYFILFLLAAIFFAAAAIGASHPKINLIALGLLCWVAVLTIHAGRALD
jgi:hypothetical protein